MILKLERDVFDNLVVLEFDKKGVEINWYYADDLISYLDFDISKAKMRKYVYVAEWLKNNHPETAI